jgi:hypothetical protein
MVSHGTQAGARLRENFCQTDVEVNINLWASTEEKPVMKKKTTMTHA